MALNKEQIRIIAENPFASDAFDSIRDKLRRDGGVPSEDLVASLLGPLFTSSAARYLSAPDGFIDVIDGLSTMQRNIGGGIKLQYFQPLIDVIVVANSTDAEIWAAVMDLLKVPHLHLRPTSIAKTFDGTPIKSSSSRLADSEARETIERELFEEIKNAPFAV